MTLSEVKKLLGLAPVEWTWLDDERCVFSVGDITYGIFVEHLTLALDTRQLTVANLSFGLLGDTFTTADDLDHGLTNRNAFQRTIFSTVAAATLANPAAMAADILVLGSSDAFKGHRDVLYTMAASEVAQQGKVPDRALWRAQTRNGTRLVLLSRVALTGAEQDQVLGALHLVKEET